MNSEIDLESIAEKLGICLKNRYYLKTTLNCTRCKSSISQFFLMIKDKNVYNSFQIKDEIPDTYKQSYHSVPTCSLCRKRMLEWTKEKLIDYIMGVR